MPKVRHWFAIPLVLFAAALALGLVAAHTSVLQPHELQWNTDIQKTRSSGLNSFMLHLADVASPVAGLVITVLIAGFFLVRKQPVQAVATFLVIAVGWNSSEIAKLIVMRHRPPTLYSLAPETGSNSFPSGHVAFAISLAIGLCLLTVGTRWLELAAVVGTLWVMLIAFDRLYIGAHYLSDVIGSVMVSTAAIIFLTGLWHNWIKDNLYRVPLLAKFGPVPGPVTGAEQMASVAG
jgi:membrane-associated phospholipid phosphatase